jgi:hypothetical protein
MEKYINKLISEPEINFDEYIKKNKINLKELLQYILEHYGGSSSDLFFLKLFKKISELTKMDWHDIFNEMHYNKLLAEESFIDFYMSYTKLSPTHNIFEFLNFSKRPKINISNSFGIRKKIVYRSCNMTEKEIQKIESFDGELLV